MENKKRAYISQWHMSYLLNELKLVFDNDFKIIPLNNNTSIQIYSQWRVLVADFYRINNDVIIVKLNGNWCSFYTSVLKSCIIKTFRWEFVPENNCCFGYFAKKNQLKFMI